MGKQENEKRRILVIDDDPVYIGLVRRTLEKEGYAVAIAMSGMEALVNIKSGIIPDLILLDLEMPYMNGYETLDTINGIMSLVDLPVIFLTGIEKEACEKQAMDLGASGYLEKPFTTELLIETVKRFL